MEWPEDFPEDHAFVELLVPDAFNELDIEQLLQDTEEKLKLNAISIEQHLKELQAMMGDPKQGDRPPSPTECMQWFNLKAASNVRLVATGHQELMDFFRTLQQYLRSEEEGTEDVTLQLLLNLSAQCGVCFPSTPSSSSCSSSVPPQHTASSVPLIHTVRDDSSREVQEAWDAVRFQLRRHLLDRLSSCSSEHKGPGQVYTLSVPERIYCLQQLCFLYPESEVLTHYQGLRSQSVLALLHSALSSSLGGETGFDRLASGFRSVAPALTQALREELHVVSRLVEPPAVLGFFNAAYLSTVARELASMMEKECETALKDNTTFCGKLRKYSAKSRATVAPMEVPAKGRSFSLTSHQLGALTQLACTLLGLESNMEELVADMILINCDREVPCVKGILKKNKEDVRVNDIKPTAGPLHTPEALTLEFDWRSAFRGLVPQMAHCVKVVLDDVCAKSLQQEEVLHTSGHTYITLSNATKHSPTAASNTPLREDSFHSCSERQTPKMIAQFCDAIMAKLDALLPLAVACRDSSLVEVRSSFVEACGRATSAVLDRLEQRALEVPSSTPLKNLPALLATCIYVHQRLGHYHARLKDSASTTARVPLTLLPIQKYQDAVEALKNQLISYCVQVCATSILHDAESHHWADPKAFYEGERCSFSVQMWFYFLCGLRSDIWAVLPADLAKDVLGQVLSETLQLLVQQYARARPSYKRHLQVRCDITALLLYVEQLMFSVCDSPEALVRCDPASAIAIISGGSNWPYQIHNLCDQLLSVMVVVTAPLSLLYGTFMNKHSPPHQPDSSGLNLVYWLNAIDPDLFTEQSIRGRPDGPGGLWVSAEAADL
uniref:KIAA0825 n=1 Tax=Myripristis murdjan TaxID=586833 RepID=A0A667Y3Q1_9TELE